MRQVPPRAADLIFALRGVGYTPQSAVADIVDNSVAAGAREVAISFEWRNGDPLVTILDNGHGMAADALTEAMRIGKDPRTKRTDQDLGRFGLGLKTASLSQARSLTVASKAAENTLCRARWDVDVVEERNEWVLLEDSTADAAEAIKALGSKPQGTLVVWEKADQLLAAAGAGLDGFLEAVERVNSHLSVVFHRLLADGRLRISINGAPVRPWDPFMRTHPACVVTPTEVISADSGRSVAFTGYTLPPASRLSADELERGAGVMGWIAAQGFYVYRNDRMIVAGGWLGLGRGSHAWRADRDHQLARISLDISNAADVEWHVDIRKGSAVLPPEFQPRIKKLATESRARAKSALRAFEPRSRPQGKRAQPDDSPIWVPSGKGAGTQFRLNRRHPLIVQLRSGNADQPALRKLLDQIDQYVPILPMAAAKAAPQEAPKALEQANIRKMVRTVYYAARKGMGQSHEEACQRLLRHPEFRDHEVFVLEIAEAYALELENP